MSVIITNILFLAAILFILVLLIIYSGSIKNLLSIKWLVIVISVMSIIFWLPTRSLIHGITVALRLDIMIITGILFVSCIRVEEFSSGLNRLGLPYRVAFAVSLAFRLIPSIFSIIQTTADAQQTRGLNLKEGNIIKKVRKYVPLFIPVISLLVRDAHQLSMALESKGFGFANKRTNYTEHAMEAPDYIALTMLLLCLVASLIIR